MKLAEREILALVAKANPVPDLVGLLDRDEKLRLGAHAPELRRQPMIDTTSANQSPRSKTRSRWTGRRLLPAVLLLVLVMGGAVAFMTGIGRDNRRIVYSIVLDDGRSELYTIAPNGDPSQNLQPDPVDCGDCTRWSPDGRKLMLTVLQGDRVVVATVNADGSQYTVLSNNGATLNFAMGIWSPDGTRFAAGGWDDSGPIPSRAGVYTASSEDGSDLRRVTTAPDGQTDLPLDFSPDGGQILFMRDETGDSNGPLFVVNVDGTGLAQLSPADAQARCCFFGPPATWSPDGTRVSFAVGTQGSRNATSSVYVVNENGTGLEEIATGGWITSARWSPTGEWIVFDKVNTTDGPHDLFLIHPDGSGLTELPTTPDGVCCAVWSPAGTQLLFQGGPKDTEDGYLFVINTDGAGEFQLTRELGQQTGYSWRP